METPAHSELACVLTSHYFGEKVGSVVSLLFNYDQVSLRSIRSIQTDHLPEDIKHALLILVKYQLADYVKTVKNFSHQYEYYVVPQRLFNFFRVPRFIQNICLKLGRSNEERRANALALSILFERGLLSENKWIELVLKHINDRTSCQINISEQELTDLITGLKFRKYVVSIGDNVCINIEKLYRDSRDDLFVLTIEKFFDNDLKISTMSKAILKLSFDTTDDDAPVTSPVPLQDIADFLCPKTFSDREMLLKYIDKLSSETNFRFFMRSGTHPVKGPMYAMNIGAVLNYLLREHVCSVVSTRFGPKCCRVFRLLLCKGPLLLKQIEECIMLPARDVREYTYMLIKEGFIRNRQVPKTPDNAPGKSIFIMSIELDRVIYNLADLSCRTIINLLTRHDFELKRNDYLLSRSKAVQNLLKNSIEPVVDRDIRSEYFNNHELLQLEQIDRTLNKIHYAKVQVDETLFLAHVWFRMRPHMEDGTAV